MTPRGGVDGVEFKEGRAGYAVVVKNEFWWGDVEDVYFEGEYLFEVGELLLDGSDVFL